MVQVGEFYQGSGLLQPLCHTTGIPIDQINFVACNLVAFVCGVLMRKTLPPCNENTTLRHVMEVSLGLVLAYFCFGNQAVHLLLYSTLPYLLMLYGPRQNYHTLVFIVAMAYLTMMHAYRMYYDYGGFSLDVTGPLMVMTQKVTSVAYALHDGTAVPEDKLSDDQRKQSIRQTPSVIAYYSYMFSFHNVMIGPLVFYSDYANFIDGKDLMILPPKQTNKQRETIRQPCPNRAIAETFVIVLVCGVLMVLAPVYLPYSKVTDDDFLYNTSFVYRNLYILVSLNLVRSKYYFAWKLGELTNLAAGLGFNGYDGKNRETWDLLTNVKIWKLETSTSIKVLMDSWNMRTMVWLRRIIYDRTPSSVNTLAVFVFSAIWHGLYPGYYVTFVSLAIAVTTGRLIRRNIRPYFLTSKKRMLFYACLTYIATRITGIYFLIPFPLLEFTAGMKVLRSIGFHCHIICLGIIIYYTFIKPAKKIK